MKKMKKSRLAKALAIALFLLTLPAALSAQNLAAWFAKPANQAAYGAIAADAEALAVVLRAASLSDSLLSKRLEEAARKQVPANVIMATLAEDVRKYLQVSQSLRLRKLQPTNAEQASTMVAQVSLLIRAGIEGRELDASLDLAVDKLGAKPAAVSRAVAALSVTAAARAEYKLSVEESLFFTAALVQSNLADRKMNSVLASIKNLIAKGGSTDAALDAVMESVSMGNSEKAKSGSSDTTNTPSLKNKEDQTRPENKGGGEKPSNTGSGQGNDGRNKSGRGD